MAGTPRRRKLGPGWIPNQHGAWAMLVAPFFVGAQYLVDIDHTIHTDDVEVAVSVNWSTVLLLFALWIVGYFAYFAISLWLRSQRKAKYFPPVRSYTIASVILGVSLAILAPQLIGFTLIFIPFLAIGLWCAHRRQDRSLLSGGCTVAAACLMVPVVIGTTFAPTDGRFNWPWVAGVTMVLFLYFFGTVLYVKTVIRERTNPSYAKASVIFHIGATIAVAGISTLLEASSPLAVMIFILLTARAWIIAGRRVRPAVIGVGEIAATILVVLACLSMPR